MVKKAHFLSLVSLCAFLLCSCNLLDFFKKPGEDGHKHKYVLVNEKTASFYEDGWKKHYTCSECNKVFNMSKNEKNSSDFSTKIPLFTTLNRKDPISLKGKDISLNFNEAEVQNNLSLGETIKNKITLKTATANEIQSWSNTNSQLREKTSTNYYYSDVLADFNATSEGYETKNKIYKAYNDLVDMYYAVFVEIAKDSTLNKIFFKSYTQQQLDDFIAKHTPSGGGGGGGGTPSISQQMETILNNKFD